MEVVWAALAFAAFVIGLLALVVVRIMTQSVVTDVMGRATLDPGQVLYSTRAYLLNVGAEPAPPERVGMGRQVARLYSRSDLGGEFYLVAPGQPLGRRQGRPYGLLGLFTPGEQRGRDGRPERPVSPGYALGWEPDSQLRMVGIDAFALQSEEIALVKVGLGRVRLFDREQTCFEFQVGTSDAALGAALAGTPIRVAGLEATGEWPAPTFGDQWGQDTGSSGQNRQQRRA